MWGMNGMNIIARSVMAASLIAGAGEALAHPHVWITAKAELVYGPEGKIVAVRHRWTFDPAYSAFATQGLDRDGNGKLTADELIELAKMNTDSLVDFGYFTHLKANGAKREFDPPNEHGMTFENGALTLSFQLPLKGPATSKTVAFEVYDPTYFVSFTMAEGDDAVTLANAPTGCSKTIARPKPADTQPQRLSESFFQALTAASNFGASYANRVIVACP
jgi:ABC-type uncharacterized transport system substrate-binding protein